MSDAARAALRDWLGIPALEDATVDHRRRVRELEIGLDLTNADLVRTNAYLGQAHATIANHESRLTQLEAAPPAEPPAEPPAIQPAEGALIVSLTGNDTTGTGTLANPYRTLAKATAAVAPGGTIYLRGGTYDTVTTDVYMSRNFSGTEANPITVSSYPGERAILDGINHPYHPRTLNDGLGDTILLYVAGSHLIFEDLTFRHSAGRCFFLEGDHNTLRNITSHDNHSDGIHLRGDHNLLEDIHAHGNYGISNGGNSGDGIKIQSASSHNTIRRAITHHNSDDGIDIWDSTHTLIENCISYANGIGPTGNGNGYKLGAGIQTVNTGNIIRRSIAYGNRGNNFDANRGGGITIIHNTSWKAGSHGYVLRHREGANPPNTAHNNISYQDTKAYVDWSAATHSHNTFDLAITDPQFVTLDPASSNFLALGSASPAIDAGLDLGNPYTGTAPDLGAVPYGTTFAGGWDWQSVVDAPEA